MAKKRFFGASLRYGDLSFLDRLEGLSITL